jgi:GNAT superfamily N-acetyltransferase
MGNDRRVLIETRRAGLDDLEPASEVLGEAFADYPWTRWTVDPEDHQGRITRLQLLALENLGMAFGEVWLSSVDGTVQSVAVWMDSAVEVPPSVHHALDAAVAALEGSRHDASLAAQRQLEGWRPIQRHFTLAVIGTAPARQRQGLAGRTLVPGLAAADREGAGSFLETSSVSNLDFYSRFGFEVIGHRRIDGGGPDVWAMFRKPMAHSGRSPVA